MRNVALRALALFDFLFLQIDRKGDVGNAAIRKRGAAGQIGDVFHVGRAHDALVEDGDVHEELVERDVLLRIGADQVVKLQAGDRQHRLAVELGVVESVQQMNAARTRGRQANAELAGELRISAGHEGGGFFVAHLNEADLVLVRAQRLHDSVDAIAGKPENDFHAPVDQPFDKYIGSSHGAHLAA